MDQTTVSIVNQLTVAAAAVIACGFLWRAYTQSVAEHIKDLREIYSTRLFDVTARVMVLEDKAGIDRKSRFDYMPPSNQRELAALADLDKQ